MMQEALRSMADEIPSKEFIEDYLKQYSKELHREFRKISKTDSIGQNFQNIHYIIVLMNDQWDKDKPKFKTFSFSLCNNDKIKEKTIENIVSEYMETGIFSKYDYSYVMSNMFSNELEKYLCLLNDTGLFWSQYLITKETLLGEKQFIYIVLEFDKETLERENSFGGEIHPYISSLKNQWINEKADPQNEGIFFNEMFRRASVTGDKLLYQFENDFNSLSALKYESANNQGSIVFLDTFEKENYIEKIIFSKPIKMEENSYKKIRKLLEITDENTSLLMNEKNEIYAIGTIVDHPLTTWYKITFRGFLKWNYMINGKIYLQFENMLPLMPSTKIGINENDLRLWKETFYSNISQGVKEIIESASQQRHGTMIVFAENALEEVKRLDNSGFRIKPQKFKKEMVGMATSIDGAMFFNPKGICYSIGTIVDGKTSRKADSSRGARYNSAIRYVEQQKEKNAKTFVVVVSEDGYINCFSTKK